MKAAALYNPLVKFILRSPLHGILSGSTLLLTFTGRKSGRQYMTPISYAREGNTILLITSRKHSWWKNLQNSAPVTARVKGQALQGAAQVAAVDEAALVEAMQKVYRGIPKSKAAQLAPQIVMIRVVLN